MCAHAGGGGAAQRDAPGLRRAHPHRHRDRRRRLLDLAQEAGQVAGQVVEVAAGRDDVDEAEQRGLELGVARRRSPSPCRRAPSAGGETKTASPSRAARRPRTAVCSSSFSSTTGPTISGGTHALGDDVGADHEDERERPGRRSSRRSRRSRTTSRASRGRANGSWVRGQPAEVLEGERGAAGHHHEHDGQQHAGEDQHLAVGQLVVQPERDDADRGGRRRGRSPRPRAPWRCPPAAAGSAGRGRPRSPRGRRS